MWAGTYGGEDVALKQLFSSMIAQDMAEVFHVRLGGAGRGAYEGVVAAAATHSLVVPMARPLSSNTGVTHARGVGPSSGAAILWLV